MRQSIIFFVSETAGVRQIVHQAYVELVRGERSVPEYAGQTVRVADWYVETCDGGLGKIDNETYSMFEFDRDGHINWPKCRHGIAANHAFYAAVMASQEMDSGEDSTIQQLRAELGEDFTWFPDKEERASMEALVFGQ
ncbi:hypothetical protein RY831_24130 [Noviherbaspirillum sp. CPCC 100848]|uniref:Uncharacterized protein n=1 Tax=Noviherbaspirillum album TaxID=3080276 RepID=A0ABU6JFL5_9BURK|nr:hypothetical protein [Noviherbaspirillum sp. CPCC 100848]MEC4722256.1 hypothetical protein [Noviherbaspirillum sp. CPCC 100848]